MKNTEGSIQKLLFERHCGASVVVPNAFFRSSRWEMDVLVVTKAGMSYEYEIKLNHADFLNERKNKAAKHRWMMKNTNKGIYANYYYFVCPEGVIEREELWDPHYGLIYVKRGFTLFMIKRAKRIHDMPFPDRDYRGLARKMMYKLFNHSDRYRNI